MCTTCGCSDNTGVVLTNLEVGASEHVHLNQHAYDDGHHHHHGHNDSNHQDHHHDHGHHSHVHLPASDAKSSQIKQLEEDVLSKNDYIAQQNKKWLAERKILALNLVSSPGSGKTTLLERTLSEIKDQVEISVVEGDQQTLLDAQRIHATGCKVVQLNTGAGCHLEADMIKHGLNDLHPSENSIVMIENVGNLVCPALFDLGERAKVAILSVTEGQDKPLKYPHMFRASRLMIINKTDLLPYVDFEIDQCIEYAKQVNPEIEVIIVSAKTGEGMQGWYSWLMQEYSSSAVRVDNTMGQSEFP